MLKSRFVFLLSVILLFSCTKAQLVKFNGNAQGTTYSITYYDVKGRDFQLQVDSILKTIDKSLSIYDSTSLVSQINRNGNPVKADEYLKTVFLRSVKVSEETGGAFDFTVGPLVNAFGFGFKNRSKIDSALIDSLKKLVDYGKVMLQNDSIYLGIKGASLDFNAIAQGYSVDIISNFLKSKGINNFLVELGGEVYASGSREDKSWTIGIEKPADSILSSQKIMAKLQLKDKAIATSGNYRKFYVENGIRYSHTIDPSTGYPVKHSMLSASVVADNCTDADAYATSFMVMGLQKSIDFLKKREDLQAYFIYAEPGGSFKTFCTKGLQGLIEEKNTSK
jgi:FAD:protein FMN transferase